jgi:hypothetical protein
VQKLIEPRSSHLPQSKHPKHHRLINGDAVVISRSVVNLHDELKLKNHCSSSCQPRRIVVERDGKQFFVEYKERTELRYVQYMDETTHQMRCFEVTDCIPYRIIRPYRDKSESVLQNDVSQNTFIPALRSVPNGQSETVTPLNSIGENSSSKKPNVLITERIYTSFEVECSFNSKKFPI